ncbi:hypothetical protein ACFVHA_29010, partial [Bacillus cereus]
MTNDERGETMTSDAISQTDEYSSAQGAVTSWLSDFESMLTAQDYLRLPELFVEDSHWRDMGAFTWDLGNVSGLGTIEKLMRASAGDVRPFGFEIAKHRTPPSRVIRSGREVVEQFMSVRNE